MFDLTEEQTMLKDMLVRFLAEAEGDAWFELAELGVIGALFPEAQGGFGGSGADLAVVFEEIGRACSPVPLIECALLPGLLLGAAGQDLSGVIAGTDKLALAHAEVAARYDLDWVETEVSDGRITGDKAVVTGAPTAARFLVTARHSGAPGDREGIGLYLVDADAPGLSLNAYQTIDGAQAADLTLSDAPATLVLEEALPALERAYAAATLAQCADTLGAMEQAAHMTREYLTTRQQFGRAIGTFQSLAHRLADMMLAVEQARSAVLLAAASLNGPEQDIDIAACKNLLGRMGRLVAEDAIQLHGGIGMTDEYALGRLAKRIIMADHRFGDTDHHLERFIALSKGAA